MTENNDHNTKRNAAIARLVVALIAGGAVAALIIGVPWLAGGMWKVRYDQYVTQRAFAFLSEAIATYEEQNGRFPESLDDLDDRAPVEDWRRSIKYDGWERPIEYVVEGGSYTLRSLGRDGEPGGVGLDCDLIHLDPTPPESTPTRGQILSDPGIGWIIQVGLAAGLVACVLTLLLVKPKHLASKRLRSFTVCMLITLFGATFIGIMMASIGLSTSH